ncbi:MAG: GvpL/GvpF family gas vesicle protein [Candidatus Methanoperedens sp.]|nr:GvpL/GvpF family gas vesicle protein [Candidatus Methanoperedens sp.]MCZ7404913.1 GvpL/GvpF family gas vesicle protein [Candidatus Methanoperedens sp.]
MSKENIGEGRYLYCITNSGAGLGIGNAGIEDSTVYTILYKDIAAVVHSCIAKPYATEDNAKAAEWILSHNYVIDCAAKKSGTVLPFSFDTIVRGNDEVVSCWLKKSYMTLKEELDRLKNKAEYSIQVFCGHEYLKAKLAGGDNEPGEMKEKMDIMPRGAAYLFRRRFELKMKDALSAEATRLSMEFSSNIQEHVEEMRADEKIAHVPEKYAGKRLIAALSCLVREDNVGRLGEALDEINKRKGFAVRFSGPWAPFSFVRRFDEPGKDVRR